MQDSRPRARRCLCLHLRSPTVRSRRVQCHARTKKGLRCEVWVQGDGDYCNAHVGLPAEKRRTIQTGDDLFGLL